MNIAKGFRINREKRHMEQQELASCIGVSKSMICAIEKGHRKPSLDTLIAVADVLRCSVDDLLDRKTS